MNTVVIDLNFLEIRGLKVLHRLDFDLLLVAFSGVT